jgi:hypothetical protein
MADLGINPTAWTDPRMMLANQLMQGAGDSSPVRSWTQELARALQGPVGAYMATKVRDDRNSALSEVFNPGSAPKSANQPGLLSRIGSSLFGSDDQKAAPEAGQPPQTGVGASLGDTSASNTPTGLPVSAPGNVQPVAAPQAAASTQPVSLPPQGASTNPLGGGLAQLQWQAQRMIQVGRERNQPDLVQQGYGILQNIQSKQAEAQISAVGHALGEGRRLDPTANNGAGLFSTIDGYDNSIAATEAAKARATELAKLDPAISAGKVAQTNTINTGTVGTEAMMSGAKSGADANARNASELAYAAPITTAKNQAAADVELRNKPELEAATTSAVNQANAGKPLTPEKRSEFEQKLSKDFQDLPAVREHIAATQGYANVLSAAKGNDKASDINLIDGLVKMFNPGATVRQGSFETFMDHSQGIPANLLGVVKSVMNGAHLQPETRAQLVAQATNRMDASRQIYNQMADFAANQAKAQGLNARNVLPPFIDPLTAQEELARRRAARGQQ